MQIGATEVQEDPEGIRGQEGTKVPGATLVEGMNGVGRGHAMEVVGREHAMATVVLTNNWISISMPSVEIHDTTRLATDFNLCKIKMCILSRLYSLVYRNTGHIRETLGPSAYDEKFEYII